jgi:ubiquinone/menaquinone biosynthesis C-methylase UbiE
VISTEKACFVPDLGPDVYERWRSSDLGRITEQLEYRQVLNLLGNVSGCRVLDIGCGDGLLAAELQKSAAEVVALDASQAMLEAAQQRARNEHVRLTLCRGRAEELPFSDASFDIVVAVTILCFVPQAQQTLSEIGRVLKPGGRLVIGELGRWSTWAARRRIKAWLGSPMWRAGRFRTPGELRRLARAGGLTPDDVLGAVFYPHSNVAARHLQRLDPWLSARTTFGAAFLILCATKKGILSGLNRHPPNVLEIGSPVREWVQP